MSEVGSLFTREYAADSDMQTAYQMGVATVLQYGVAVREAAPAGGEEELLDPAEYVLQLPVGLVEKIEPQMVPTFGIQDDLTLIAQRPDDGSSLALYLVNDLGDHANIARIGEPTEQRQHWGAFLQTMRTKITIADATESPEAGRQLDDVRVFEDVFYPYQAHVLNTFLRKLAQKPVDEVIRDRIDLTGMSPEQRANWCQERRLNKEVSMSVVASATQQEEVHMRLGNLAWQWGEGSEPDPDTTLSELSLSAEKLRERVPRAIRLLEAAGRFKIGVSVGAVEAATTVMAHWDVANAPLASERSVTVRSARHGGDRVTSLVERVDGTKDERVNGLRNLEAQALLEIATTLGDISSEEEMAGLQATEEDRVPNKIAGALYGRW